LIEKAVNTYAKVDTQKDTNQTPKRETTRLSDSVRILEVLKSEPDYNFTIRDVVLRTGIKTATVNRNLNRLSSSGKGAGPVNHVGHGLYRYALEKEGGSFTNYIGSISPKFENLVFTKTVRLEARSIPVSDVRVPEILPNRTPPDARIPTPRAGFPYTLPTGQQVSWELYANGTEIVRISANGKPPLSADSVLLVLSMLKKFGLNGDTWICTSMEMNIDSRKHRIDASYSLQIIDGLITKAYQHGYNARLELADRRSVPAREVWDLFHAVAGRIDGTEALRKAEALDARVKKNETDTHLALNIARKVLESKHQCKCTEQAHKKQNPPATFTPASALRQRPVLPASQRAGP
jgi:hypothetical protein